MTLICKLKRKSFDDASQRGHRIRNLTRVNSAGPSQLHCFLLSMVLGPVEPASRSQVPLTVQKKPPWPCGWEGVSIPSCSLPLTSDPVLPRFSTCLRFSSSLFHWRMMLTQPRNLMPITKIYSLMFQNGDKNRGANNNEWGRRN